MRENQRGIWGSVGGYNFAAKVTRIQNVVTKVVTRNLDVLPQKRAKVTRLQGYKVTRLHGDKVASILGDKVTWRYDDNVRM